MTNEAIAALVGAVVGSLLTFLLGQVANSINQRNQQKRHVFAVLMAGRGRIASKDTADAINLIPVVFAGDRNVEKAYQHFCAAAPSGGTLLLSRYTDLTLAVARSAGFRSFSEADVNLGFFPPFPFTPPEGLQ